MAELDADQRGGQGGSGKPPDGVFSLNVPFSKGSITVQVSSTNVLFSAVMLSSAETVMRDLRQRLDLFASAWRNANP